MAGSFIWSEVGSLNPSILGIPHSLSIIYPCYTRGEKQMNALDILFRSGSFNLSKVGEHFINPCCFGEDLAAWLQPRLSVKGVEIGKPYQEDWGWELPFKCEQSSYYLCMSGNADDEGNNQGEWRIIVEKRRSICERLIGKGKIADTDLLTGIIEQILSEEPSITDIQRGP